MKLFEFNIRANGIFADGFVDRDGAPVRDTFVSQLRAKMIGPAGLAWSKSQNAAFAASLSSAEMNAIMSPVNHLHMRVEFDTSFYGGDYTGQGEYAYVPEALVDVAGGDLPAAFAMLTRIDSVHIVSYESEERFDADGQLLEEAELALDRCA